MPRCPSRSASTLLLAEMTLAEKVGQTHQVANIDPEADAETLRAGRISSSLYASGATAGNERDEGVLVGNIDAAQRHAGRGEPARHPGAVRARRDPRPPHGRARSRSAWPPRSTPTSSGTSATIAAARGGRRRQSRGPSRPMVDISEEPRWGRVAESLGEAPVLAGRLAAAAVRGFQGDGPVDARPASAACAKHFAGYGLSAGGRDYDTVSASARTPCATCTCARSRHAVEAGVLTVMAAFNDVDGTPMHAHRAPAARRAQGRVGLRRRRRRRLERRRPDRATKASPPTSARRPGWPSGRRRPRHGQRRLPRAPRRPRRADGEVDVALVDDAVPSGAADEVPPRALRRRGRMPRRPGGRTSRRAGPRDGRARARRAAHVLVKNDGRAARSPTTRRCSLTGGFVDEGEVLLGTWVLDGRGEDVVSPAAGARRAARRPADGRRRPLLRPHPPAGPRRRRDRGTGRRAPEPLGRGQLGRRPPAAARPARPAARRSPGSASRCVAVVYTGRPLDLSEVLDLADAVLVVWHPGVEAGTALADVLTRRRRARTAGCR